MGTGPTSQGSPWPHMRRLTILTLLLLAVVGQTKSQDYYESWNYGRNRLIGDMKEEMKKMREEFSTSIKEIKKEIQFIRYFSNIPTKEENFASLGCPDYFQPLDTTNECILIAKQYATHQEATASCESLGAHLAVPEDVGLLKEFLNGAEIHSTLSDDVFWIGADNKTSMLRWVNGQPLPDEDSLRSLMSGPIFNYDKTYERCVVLDVRERYPNREDQLSTRYCDDPSKHPYICEISPGSESIILEAPSFNSVCPEGFIPLPTGECIYISSIDESLSYYKAGNFCETHGGMMYHPRNVTLLASAITELHSQNLEDNSNNQPFQEDGFWVHEYLMHGSQEWQEMMEQSKQENGGSDVCTLLKIEPTKLEITTCSSSQRFTCRVHLRSQRASDMVKELFQ